MNIPQRLLATLAVSLALVVAACGGGASAPSPTPAPTSTAPPATAASATATTTPEPGPTSTPTPLAELREQEKELAPELTGISGWLNSGPLTLESQRGKVVLIDFWTYTCVNCIRTLPYIKSWHDKYSDSGLVVLGVHTPEFEFEKRRANVEAAVARFGIKYPVAQDNDFGTWDAFENRAWPAKYLIDKDGYIRFTHLGEGAYAETEQLIRKYLEEAGADLSGISPDVSPAPEFDPASIVDDPSVSQTRELYAGYARNYGVLLARTQPPYVLHREYYEERDVAIEYQDPGQHQNHFIYLNGLWRNGPESIVHARQTDGYEDYIAIRFYATNVNAVMAPVGAGTAQVRITVDDAPLKREHAGADVMYDGEGNSYVLVNESRMYELINVPEFKGYELKLLSNSPEFSLFTFTFGAYKNQPGS